MDSYEHFNKRTKSRQFIKRTSFEVNSINQTLLGTEYTKAKRNSIIGLHISSGKHSLRFNSTKTKENILLGVQILSSDLAWDSTVPYKKRILFRGFRILQMNLHGVQIHQNKRYSLLVVRIPSNEPPLRFHAKQKDHPSIGDSDFSKETSFAFAYIKIVDPTTKTSTVENNKVKNNHEITTSKSI